MANSVHIQIFAKGKDHWNEWRKRHPDIRPDLSGFEFAYIKSNLRRYAKPGLNTTTYGIFMRYNLVGFDLSNTNLSSCIFWEAIIQYTNFAGADLSNAEFRQTWIGQTNLSASNLCGATFVLTSFREVQFAFTRMGQSHFAYSPFLDCTGLESVVHLSQSHVDFLTLAHSKLVSFAFAEHFGLSKDVFEKISGLEVERYKDCFISYSTRDTHFVTTLWTALINCKIPVWFAPRDYRLNTPWFKKELIDYELSRDLYNMVDASDVVILILSNDSLKSKWVEAEIRRVRDQIILPIQIGDLDSQAIQGNTWYNSIKDYMTIDARSWQNDEIIFRKMLATLLYNIQKRPTT